MRVGQYWQKPETIVVRVHKEPIKVIFPKIGPIYIQDNNFVYRLQGILQMYYFDFILI